ncbi:MAG: nicotinamide-nucleotide amidohydrolase family protein [Ruminococcus sp.]|nr:nicotinamide-nucleotide amidohydrolase family protein [Ruminococcus sp.]
MEQNFVIDSRKMRQFYQETEKALDKTISNVVQLLDREGKTIATAESCTGGLLSQLLTSVSGASRVFELGLVTYAASMKTKLLDVPKSLIERYGVVSTKVALAMLEGLHKQSGADVCLSVTGLAGPSGGTPKQPVGTVYLGLRVGKWQSVVPLELWHFGLKTRDEIRQGTAICAFGLVQWCLMEESVCRKKKKLQ